MRDDEMEICLQFDFLTRGERDEGGEEEVRHLSPPAGSLRRPRVSVQTATHV